jgi:transposase
MLRSDPLPAVGGDDLAVYDLFVAVDHRLCQFDRVVDFERFRPELAAAYSAEHGRPPVDPILMLRAEVVRVLYGLSDRQVMERAKTDVAFRWFLRLGVKDTVPDHTNGTHFRQRIGAERLKRVLQALVTQARDHGLVKDRLRLKDATHLLANVADPGGLGLVSAVRDRLLAAARPLFPDWVVEQTARVAAIRAATAEQPDLDRLMARVEYVRELVAEVWTRLSAEPTRSDPPWVRLTRAAKIAEHLLANLADPKGGDKLVSPHDPDARVGKHGEFYVGYLLDIAIDPDSELVTAVNVLSANGAEAADAVVLLKEEQAAQGNQVDELSMDGAGWNGPVLRELTDPNGLNVQVTVPPPAEPSRKTFGPERFSLRVLANGVCELTCPAGQTTRQRERNEKDTSDKYVFSIGKCRHCRLRGECLENPKPTKGRTVHKNDYAAEYQALRARAQTPAYARTRREHSKVERKLNELVRHHGARRARYRGHAKVLYQAVLTVFVVNVKRMAKLLAGRGPPLRAAIA